MEELYLKNLKSKIVIAAGCLLGIVAFACLCSAIQQEKSPGMFLCVILSVLGGCFFGSLAEWLSERTFDKEMRNFALWGGAAASGIFIYAFRWYFLSLDYLPLTGEVAEILIGKHPTLYTLTLISLLSYGVAYLLFATRIVYISDVQEEDTLSGTADSYALEVERQEKNSEAICNMRMMARFWQKGFTEDEVIDADASEQFRFDEKSEEVYLIRYNDRAYGYFIVKRAQKAESKEEILCPCEFYAPFLRREAPAVLSTALEWFYLEHPGKLVEIRDLQELTPGLRDTLEIAVNSFTEHNYDLFGEKDENGKMHYGVRFRISKRETE